MKKSPMSRRINYSIKEPCPFADFVVVEAGEKEEDGPADGLPLELMLDHRSEKGLFRGIGSGFDRIGRNDEQADAHERSDHRKNAEVNA